MHNFYPNDVRVKTPTQQNSVSIAASKGEAFRYISGFGKQNCTHTYTNLMGPL